MKTFKTREGKRIILEKNCLVVKKPPFYRKIQVIIFSEISSIFTTKGFNDWSFWPLYDRTIIIEKNNGRKFKIKRINKEYADEIINIINNENDLQL